jgi:hypothetical protein
VVAQAHGRTAVNGLQETLHRAPWQGAGELFTAVQPRRVDGSIKPGIQRPGAGKEAQEAAQR